MTGTLYIDGMDAYVNYGVFITSGGYKELACFPQLKAVSFVDWPEEDGIDADLSDPKLDTKEVSVSFGVHRMLRIQEFFEHICDGAYHAFDFHQMGRVYKLRLLSQTIPDIKGELQMFTLRFADDFPISEDYIYVEPLSSVIQTGYELDGRSLSEYGVYVLQGSDAEVQKYPDVKQNLIRNIVTQNGAIYDGENVRFKSKDVKLSCLMCATSLDEFWRNYNALLYDLVRPGERSFYADSTGYEYPCYYKNCSVSEFYPTGKIWFKFDLTLVFTSGYRGRLRQLAN